MTQDSEKRFHSIMDKLFHTSQSSPSSNSTSSSSPSGVELPRGKKRPYSSFSRVDVNEVFQKHSSAPAGSSGAPLCRPWDRSDLLKRLATFKSMTWFGKPKECVFDVHRIKVWFPWNCKSYFHHFEVVSAVNCARRGWINVDMDIIACESCGARLLFSTPSSWNHQQVEKAALVFSLKLDNGHKLLCPWIDNACDEPLAEFPPTPPPILVDRFRERCSMLLLLSALPIISSSFIKWMKSPILEQFLEESSLLEFGDESLNKSEIEYLGDGHDSETAKVYYQALKLICLFGWEPRALPYVVDCKTGSKQSIKTSNILDSSCSGKQNSSITNENIDGKEIIEISSKLQSHPNSVVLDCRLCGASVGLWTFHTAPRPVEIIRLVGPAELNSESGAHDSGNKNCINYAGIANVGTSSKEATPNLTYTIAGGPTPARQNFKATITLPVIGQNLRARLFDDIEFRDHMYNNEEIVQNDSRDKNLLQDSENNKESTPTEQAQPEDTRVVQIKTLEHGCGTSGDDQIPSLEGTNSTEQGNLPKSGLNGAITGTFVESTANVLMVINEMLENDENSGQSGCAINTGELDPANKAGELNPGPSPVENSFMETDDNDTNRSHQCSENKLPSIVVFDKCDLQQVSENDTSISKEANLQVSPHNSSCLEVDTDASITSKNELTQDKRSSDNHPNSGNQDHEGSCVKDKVQTCVNSEVITYGGDNYLKDAPLDKIMEFDPIRQHRHFCSWIAAGSVAPGWKQTLTALQRQKSSSLDSPKNSPSASLIKVDDPVKSVRDLFTSSAKKLKSSLVSNENTKR